MKTFAARRNGCRDSWTRIVGGEGRTAAKYLTGILFTLLLAIPAGSNPQQPPDIGSTHGYLDLCKFIDGGAKTTADYMDWGFCDGWTRGYVEAMMLQSHPPACPPQTSTTDQGVHIIMKYIKDHPEQMHLPTPIIAMRAFKSAFPCE
jgi:hypothetical protein